MSKFLRVFIVLFTCMVMWLKPNSGIDFFRSLIILSMGYGYDYWTIREAGMTDSDSYLVNLGTVGVVISLLFFSISLAGLGGMLVIRLEETPITIVNSDLMMTDISFRLTSLVMMLNVFPILAGFEFWGKVRESGGA